MSDASREEEVFADTLARPAAERAAFLERECAGEAALRASVESLLAAHERPVAFIDRARVVPIVAPPEEQPGDQIGRYRLMEQIGEGGYGVVYLAEQVEPVRRRVAVKVIKLGMDTKAVIARFDAERQALALMEHPNIAKVLDAGATDAGRPYFVMELVRGAPITRFCDERTLSTAERIGLFVQVCRAIQHAHQKGVIHRDIKPSNIIVSVHDAEAVPKVIDFGIAKATQGRLTDQTIFTAGEQFVGTPAYTSPEQANAGSLDVDTRSDLYSLGVLLYELLTGRTPFDAKALAKAGLEEVRRQIREVEPPRPSTQLGAMPGEALETAARQRQTTAPKLINAVRGDLDWIVMRCLEKDRRRRYDTAGDLALDLERHLGNEEVKARPPSTAYRLGKMVQRHKLAVGAAAAVAAALVVGLGIATWSLVKEKAARERAVAAERKAVSEAKKSEQVAQFLQAMLQGIGPSAALGRDTALLREIVDQTAARLELDLRDQPEVEAELRHTLGRVYFELGDYERAKAMHEGALEKRKKLFGAEHPDVARSLRELALVRNAQGDAVGAEGMLREALGLQRRLLGGENLEVADTLSNLATVLHTKRDSTGAATEQQAVLALRRKLGGDRYDAVARTMTGLALSVEQMGDLVSAERLAREALDMHRRLSGKDHPAVAATLHALGTILFSRHDFQGAEESLREAVEIQRRVLGNEHPDLAMSLQVLASVLLSQADDRGGEVVAREALAVHRKALGEEHPRVAVALRHLAMFIWARGDFASAESIVRQALALQRKLLGNEHLDVADTLGTLAYILQWRTSYDAAKEAALEGIAIRRRLHDPNLRQGLHDFGEVLELQGGGEELISVRKEMVMHDRARLGSEDRVTVFSELMVAHAYYLWGDIRAAAPIAEEAVERFRRMPDFHAREMNSALSTLGRIRSAAGRYDDAIALFEELAQAFEKRYGLNYRGTTSVIRDMAELLRVAGRFEEAEKRFRQVLQLWSAYYSADFTGLAGTRMRLGHTLIQTQRFAEAEAMLRPALAVFEHKMPESWNRYFAMALLGRAVAGQQRHAEAEPLLLTAFDNLVRIERYMPVPEWGRITESAQFLALLYKDSGRSDLAEEWQRKVQERRVAENARLTPQGTR